MQIDGLSILLVEDSASDAELLEEELARVRGVRFRLERACRLNQALEMLETGQYDVVLLDLTLPDARGEAVFRAVQKTAPELPVVVLTGIVDSRLAMAVVREGAQDYLIKDEVEGRSLVRALGYAIERKKLQLQAEEMSRKKTEFLALVTHELRNPMTGIVGYAHLLRQTELSQLQKEYVDTIRASARGLRDLLNNLLELSSVETGRMSVERAPMELRACLEEVTSFVVPQALKAGLEVVTSLDAGLPDLVLGDALKLRQVVLNLLMNALKFTERGYVGLSARVKSTHRGQTVIRFVVEDSGRGIPPEKKKAIFQPFHQAESQDRSRGAGLGLAICLRTIEAMNGVMGVESQVGQGTAFWFDLPFEVLTPASTGRRLEGRRVLLAEPHPETARAVRLLLEQLGAAVDLVGTELEAYQLARTHDYDVMVAAEGIKLVSRIPVRLVTSHERRGSGEHGERYLARPLRQQEFLEALAGAPVREAPAVEGRVLVVDDDRVCRIFLEKVAADMGFACRSAGAGEEALALLEEEPADLLLMDCGLPDMDGEQLASTVHQRRLLADGGLVFAITGAPDRRLEESGLVDAVLTKPAEFEEIEQAYRRCRRPIVDQAVLDRLKDFEKRSGKGFLSGLVATYESAAAERMAGMRAATSHEEIQRLAHALKGAAATIGASAVAGMAERVERCTEPAYGALLIERLETEVRRSRQELRRHLEERLSC